MYGRHAVSGGGPYDSGGNDGRGRDDCQSGERKIQGDNRNPWCEIECGSYYARSMASYALLLSYSGFVYDAAAGIMGFRPVIKSKEEDFSSFWSMGSGWGTVRYRKDGSIWLEIIRGSWN